MLKYLFFTRDNQLNTASVYVVCMAVIAGLSFFALSVMILSSTIEVINGRYPLDHLAWSAVVFFVFITTKHLSLVSGNDLIERALEKERNRLADLIRHTELDLIERVEKGAIYTRMTMDIKRISMIFRSGINLIQGAVVFSAIWIYFFTISIKAGLLVLFLVLIYQLLNKAVDPLFRKKSNVAMESETRLFDFFGHVIEGFKELKQNQIKSTDFFLNYLLPLIDETKSRRVAANDEFVNLIVCTNALGHLSMGAIIFVLNFGNPDVTLKLFIMYGFLIQSVAIILSNLPEVLEANVAVSRIAELETRLKHSLEKDRSGYAQPSRKTQGFKEIEIKDLCFDYTDKKGETTFSLGPINMTIKSGEIVFLTGGNGGGKSTLLKLIPGLYPPLSGSFTIDGVQGDMRHSQHLFSAIYADSYLFDRLYGVVRPDDNKINDLLISIGLSRKVRWENQTLKYYGLSSGQKKRLAFIVSLLEDKPIYIFDEWAAEQDPIFRKTFYTKLLPSIKADGKTIIAASHDDRYFHVADKVITMNYGIIEESNRNSKC